MIKSNDPKEIFSQALQLWKPTGNTYLDSQVLDLFHSGFFKQYAVSTEQMFFILDHKTMKYLYVSDNFPDITGHAMTRLYDEGIQYTMEDFHPDDALKFATVTGLI